jgi:hypothetical protein
VYKKKKSVYEEELSKYNEAVQIAEKEYYATFKNERTALIQSDNKEREETIQNLTIELGKTKENLKAVNNAIEKEDIVGRSLKNSDDIQLLIDIFDNKRANSIKEAINILFEDKHRKRMEELQEWHVKLTEEAKEAAENAASSAEEAIRIAYEAMELAEEACNKAEDTYNEAEDTYNEASYSYSDDSDD